MKERTKELLLFGIGGSVRFRMACAVLLLAVARVSAAHAGDVSVSTVCRGLHALCSSAQCRPVKGDKDYAVCRCAGPLLGPNIANSPCAARDAKITAAFSLADLLPVRGHVAKTPLHCAGSDMNRWADCLDAPCTGIKGGLACTCRLQPISAFSVLSAACPTDSDKMHALCAKIWPSATDAELASEYRTLQPLYHDVPKLAFCPAVTKP